jgi:hypothetical protein
LAQISRRLIYGSQRSFLGKVLLSMSYLPVREISRKLSKTAITIL